MKLGDNHKARDKENNNRKVKRGEYREKEDTQCLIHKTKIFHQKSTWR